MKYPCIAIFWLLDNNCGTHLTKSFFICSSWFKYDSHIHSRCLSSQQCHPLLIASLPTLYEIFFKYLDVLHNILGVYCGDHLQRLYNLFILECPLTPLFLKEQHCLTHLLFCCEFLLVLDIFNKECNYSTMFMFSIFHTLQLHTPGKQWIN